MTAPSTVEMVSLSFLFIALLVVLLQWRVMAISKQLGVLSRIESKLDLLLKQAGIKYDPYKNIPSDVADAVRRGAKIEAIKRYRESSGTSLKEA